MTERFFRRNSEKQVLVDPQSEVDKLLADGWVEVSNLDLTPDELRAQKVAEKKAEAHSRILALVPTWTEANHAREQRNALMRSARLLRRKIDGTITAEETAELNALDAIGAQIEAIRAASDLIEADIVVAADPASFDVAASPRWP